MSLTLNVFISNLQQLNQLDPKQPALPPTVSWLGRNVSWQEAISNIQDIVQTHLSFLNDQLAIQELLVFEHCARKAGADIASLHQLLLLHIEENKIEWIELKEGSQNIKIPAQWLMLESPYFKEMLIGPYRESTSKTVVLQEDTDDETLALFSYLTYGQLELKPQNVLATLEVANKYCLDSLQNRCDHYLSSYLTENDLIENLEVWVEITLENNLLLLKKRLQTLFYKLSNTYGRNSEDLTTQKRLLILGKTCELLFINPFSGFLSLKQCIFLISCCPFLKSLYLNELSIDSSFLTLLPHSLRKLVIDYCEGIQDEDIKALPPLLQTLELRSCDNLTDHALIDLPAALQKLDLNGCRQITDKGFVFLPRSLKKLNLTGCSITDEGFKDLPSNLTNLDLSLCNKFTDNALSHLPDSLQQLNLSYCSQLTHEALKNLPPSLQELTLTHCLRITGQAIRNLLDKRPSLTIKNHSATY